MTVSSAPSTNRVKPSFFSRVEKVRREEEGLEIVVGVQGVDKLAELVSNHVELAALGGDLEERPCVDLGDFFH